LVRLLILTALLVLLPQWGNTTQNLLQSSILSGLGIDPANVQDQYNALLVIKRDTSTDRSWWDILGDLNGFTVEILVSGILWLLGQFASLLVFWAYVFQKVILYLGYALSPLLIGFMAIPPLRSIGNRYLMHLVGVLLWPLGWAVAALVTQGILDFMTDPSLKFVDPTATFYSLQTTFGVAVLAFWIVFSTVAAPLVIQKVFTDGALAGSQLVAGAFGSFVQTAATATGAAAVASTTGAPLATLGAAGMAAMLSTLSSAAGHGSAGAIIIAGSGLPPRGARGRPGDDITGDKSVRDLIARTRGRYY
ncbi:MAG: type IV secretion system protein, partial [Verrucomicrobiota bacterium]